MILAYIILFLCCHHHAFQTRLFLEADVPWSEMAFPTGKAALRHHFKSLADPACVLPLQMDFTVDVTKH